MPFTPTIPFFQDELQTIHASQKPRSWSQLLLFLHFGNLTSTIEIYPFIICAKVQSYSIKSLLPHQWMMREFFLEASGRSQKSNSVSVGRSISSLKTRVSQRKDVPHGCFPPTWSFLHSLSALGLFLKSLVSNPICCLSPQKALLPLPRGRFPFSVPSGVCKRQCLQLQPLTNGGLSLLRKGRVGLGEPGLVGQVRFSLPSSTNRFLYYFIQK